MGSREIYTDMEFSETGCRLFMNNHFIVGEPFLDPHLTVHRTINAQSLARALRHRRRGPAIVQLMAGDNSFTLLINGHRFYQFSTCASDPRLDSKMLLWAVDPAVLLRVIQYKDPVDLAIGGRYQTREGPLVMIFAHGRDGYEGVFIDDGATGVWHTSGHYHFGDYEDGGDGDDSWDLILRWDDAIQSAGP